MVPKPALYKINPQKFHYIYLGIYHNILFYALKRSIINQEYLVGERRQRRKFAPDLVESSVKLLEKWTIFCIILNDNWLLLIDCFYWLIIEYFYDILDRTTQSFPSSLDSVKKRWILKGWIIFSSTLLSGRCKVSSLSLLYRYFRMSYR